VYHEQSFPLPAVEQWHLSFADRTRDLEDEPRSECPKETHLKSRIAELLSEKPFVLYETTRALLEIPTIAYFRVLHEELELIKLCLPWVPHALDVNQLTERPTLSHQLLQVLRSNQEHNFKNIVMGRVLTLLGNVCDIWLIAAQR
jgi:hypothetical protein